WPYAGAAGRSDAASSTRRPTPSRGSRRGRPAPEVPCRPPIRPAPPRPRRCQSSACREVSTPQNPAPRKNQPPRRQERQDFLVFLLGDLGALAVLIFAQ